MQSGSFVEVVSFVAGVSLTSRSEDISESSTNPKQHLCVAKHTLLFNQDSPAQFNASTIQLHEQVMFFILMTHKLLPYLYPQLQSLMNSISAMSALETEQAIVTGPELVQFCLKLDVLCFCSPLLDSWD
jgi:hypothetical protein